MTDQTYSLGDSKSTPSTTPLITGEIPVLSKKDIARSFHSRRSIGKDVEFEKSGRPRSDAEVSGIRNAQRRARAQRREADRVVLKTNKAIRQLERKADRHVKSILADSEPVAPVTEKKLRKRRQKKQEREETHDSLFTESDCQNFGFFRDAWEETLPFDGEYVPTDWEAEEDDRIFEMETEMKVGHNWSNIIQDQFLDVDWSAYGDDIHIVTETGERVYGLEESKHYPTADEEFKESETSKIGLAPTPILKMKQFKAKFDEKLSDVHSSFIHFDWKQSLPNTFGQLYDSLVKQFNHIERIAQLIHDCLLYIYQLSKCKVYMDFYACTYSFIGHVADQGFVKNLAVSTLAAGLITMFVGENDNVIQTESLSQAFSDAAKSIDFILESRLASALRVILLSACTMHFFPKDISFSIAKYFGRMEATTIPKLMVVVLNALSTIMNIGELVFEKGMSLTDALMSDNPMFTYTVKAKVLIAQQDLLYSGLPVPGMREIREYAVELEETLAFFKVMVEKSGAFKKESVDVVNYYTQLAKIHGQVNQRLFSSTREPPFGVVLYGGPGIGKSHLVKHVCHIMSRVRGRPFDPDQIFHRVVTSDYWDGYNPRAHPFLHYPELGTTSKQLVKTQGDAVTMELTSVIDSNPLLLNTAFTDKGKVYCIPEMVVIDTNEKFLNFHLLVNNPSAFMRRFVWITPHVKPEYQKEECASIDPKKCNDGKKFLDRWFFTIETYSPLDNMNVTTKIHANHVDIFGLTKILFDLMADHIKVNTNVNESIVNTFSDDDYFSFEGLQENKEQVEIIAENNGAEMLPQIINFAEDFLEDKKIVKKKNPQVVSESSDAVMLTVQLIMMFMLKFAFAFTSNLFMLWSLTFSFLIQFVLMMVYRNYSSRRDSAVSKAVSYFPNILILVFSWLLGCPRLGIFLSASLASFGKNVSDGVDLSNKKLKNIKSQINYYGDYTRYLLGYFPDFQVNTPPELYDQGKAFKYLCAIGASALVIQIMKFLYRKIKTPEASSFLVQSAMNAPINNIEAKTHCGGTMERHQTAATSSWINVTTSHDSVIKTKEEREAMEARVLPNVRNAKIFTSDGYLNNSHFLGICNGYVLGNKHAFANNPNGCVLFLSKNGELSDSTEGYLEHKIDATMWVDLGNDLIMISVKETFFDIRKFLAVDKVKFAFASGWINGEPIKVTPVSTHIVAANRVGPIVYRDTISYNWPAHKAGRCGLPVYVQKDSGYRLLAVHSAGGSDHDCYAACFTLKDVEDGIQKLRAKTSFMELSSESSTTFFDRVPHIHPKSFMFHENLHELKYYGTLPGFVNVNQKSRLQETFMAKDKSLHELFFDAMSFTPQQRYERPCMIPHLNNKGEWISPYNLTARKMAVHKPALDQKLLNYIIDELTLHIVTNLHKRGINHWNPVDMDKAINGIPEDAFFRRVNATTAAGYGLKGKKGDHIPIVEEKDGSVTREPTEELKQRLHEQLQRYLDGENNMFVYNASLKDEARLAEKVAAGKTRVFYASPLDALILSRMYLSPFYTSMVESSYIYCTAVGINMHMEASRIYDELKLHSDLIMEGDYGNYDLGMPFEIGHAACSVIYRVCKLMGYNDEAMKIVQGLLTDSLFPLVNMLQELFCSPGLQPSGKYATAEDNGLRGLILLMYAFYTLHGTKVSFFHVNKPFTYGDDLVNAVLAAYKDTWNNVIYSEFVEKNYGMTFTPASKSGELKPFVTLDTMSFLKRTFSWHERLGRIVGKLEMDSIFRSLQWTIPSKFENPETQFLSTGNSAMRELYFHSNERDYEKFRQGFCQAYSTHFEIPLANVIQKTLSYEELTVALTPTTSENKRVGSGMHVVENDIGACEVCVPDIL